MHKSQHVFLVILFFTILWAGCKQQQGSVPEPNLGNHPVYKHYSFSKDEKVIELGAVIPSAAITHLIEVMKRDEILKEELRRIGYTVKFYFFLESGDMIPSIKNGSLEGAILGDTPTLMLMMASVGKVTIISLFGKGSVALVSRDAYRVQDLKNKRVAYPYGSSAHYYLLRLLKEKGLSDADIKHVPMKQSDMIEAFKQKRIDAFATFEPTATIYTKIDPTLHIINRSFANYNFLSIRKEYATKHRQAILAVLAAQFRAMAWLRASERNLRRASYWVAEDAGKIIPLPMENYIADLDALCNENLLSNITDYIEVVNSRVLGGDGDMRKEFEFLKTQGIIPQQSDWKDIKKDFDTHAVPDVLKNRKLQQSRIRP